MSSLDKPLIVIVGPTASGKTSLAVELAEKINGEIICADSRTVYTGLDVGTAKPTSQDKQRVPHWGLDLIYPGEYFSVADFQSYAQNKINEIRLRGKVPFLVGGTGLYVDAVIFKYNFGKKANAKTRKLLNVMTLEQLHQYCKNHNILLPENLQNKRYVIRAIERNGENNSRSISPIDNSIIVGITTDKTILRTRIEGRIEQFFKNGVVGEAKIFGEKYGWDNEALKGNVYPLVHSYLLGDMTLNDIKIKLVTIDWRLAKRQLTWLRRNSFIQWMSAEKAKLYISEQLAMRA